jgi:hypothetical protein
MISNQIEIFLPEAYLATDFKENEDAAAGKAESENGSASQMGVTTSSYVESRVPSLTGIFSSLGAGRANPFQNYPILMNKSERWLMDKSTPSPASNLDS